MYQTPYLHWHSAGAQQRIADYIGSLVADNAEPEDFEQDIRRSLLWHDVDRNPILRDRLEALDSSWWNRLQRNRFAEYIRSELQKGSSRRSWYYDPYRRQGDGVMDKPEIELLSKYVLKDPPFHIRRTLDQYYYSWLENTACRDHD
jgi:hypothetical protein